MLIANKRTVIDGKPYEEGQPVDGSLLAPGKAQQLVARRILRDDAITAPRSCVVLRDVCVRGRLYKRGMQVNASRLPAGKLSQMLDHRILGLTMER